jgi:hypothetical protein
MDHKTGRADHIEDILIDLHSGQWFGWSDPTNKIYANLIIHPKIWDESYEGNIHEDGLIDNPYSKPTEKSLTDALTVRQSEFDAQEYARNRAIEYPSIAELTVALYDTDDKAALETKRAAVKTKWPKDNSGPVE